MIKLVDGLLTFVDHKIINEFYRELKGLKMGMEVETGYEYLEREKIDPYCKYSKKYDGSIHYQADREYATQVITGMDGAKRFLSFISALHIAQIIADVKYEYLKVYSAKIDIPSTAGVHVHLSGYEHNRLFLCALYCLMYRLQNDVMSITNPFNGSKYSFKTNDYQHPIPYIFSDLASKPLEYIVPTLSSRIKALYCNKYHVDNREYRGLDNRYFIINYQNVYSNPHCNTVEFRAYSAVADFKILLLWALLSIYIYRYAYTHSEFILCHLHKKKITLEDVIRRSANSQLMATIAINTTDELRKVAIDSALNNLPTSNKEDRRMGYGRTYKRSYKQIQKCSEGKIPV